MRTAAALRREAEVTEALAGKMSRLDERDEMQRLAVEIRRQADAAELAESATVPFDHEQKAPAID